MNPAAVVAHVAKWPNASLPSEWPARLAAHHDGLDVNAFVTGLDGLAVAV